MAKRPTAREVAELAGVSRTTVSFVLNNVPGMRISEETRQRVLQAARQLHYYPDATARRMVAGRTKIIGFVLRQRPEQAFADMFLPQVLSGLSRVASAEGYHVLFEPIPPEDQMQPYLRLIHERHVDGIILSGPRFDDQELLQTEIKGTPIVLMGQLPTTNLPFVDIDNSGGARLATKHLIHLGHQRIAMITNAELAYTASASRLEGYRQALEAAGIAYDPTLVRYGNFTPQSGQFAMADLLTHIPRPTAVFVASDTVALGALQAIRQVGLKIPDDIAVVGYDDIPLAEYIDPPLTTVRLPAAGLGWGAAELLIRLITAEEEVHDTNVILEAELVVRASCGAQSGHTQIPG
ncbi:MAG: LacI family transcriptional regulator [Chloroflexi bacterium]|nr:MAG: LacI family transcriptional regulator [Chloroflexota bacterium]